MFAFFYAQKGETIFSKQNSSLYLNLFEFYLKLGNFKVMSIFIQLNRKISYSNSFNK